MTVSGACVSTVQVKLAGVGSGLWAWSMARTWKVWLPSTTVYWAGLEQGAKALPLRLHSKALPGSVAWKVKFAVVWLVGLNGMLSRSVSGGAVSTDQLNCAGVGSTLPAASLART